MSTAARSCARRTSTPSSGSTSGGYSTAPAARATGTCTTSCGKAASSSAKVVRRLMAERGLPGRLPEEEAALQLLQGGRYRTRPQPGGARLPRGRPNKLWLTDITEFKLPSEEKAYLSPVIDCYDGLVVAWRIGRRPNAALANGSLEDACGTLPGPAPGLPLRTGDAITDGPVDRHMRGNGLVRSMSKKGCSPDNSACEASSAA